MMVKGVKMSLMKAMGDSKLSLNELNTIDSAIDSLREGRASSVLGNLSRNPSCNLRLLSLESTFSRK